MSLYAMAWAKRQRTGDHVRKHVLITLADYAGETGLVWVSQERMAFDTELSNRTIRRALADLEDARFISRHKRGRRADGSRQTDIIQLEMSLPVTESGSDLTTGQPVQNHRSACPPNRKVNCTYPSIQGRDLTGYSSTGGKGSLNDQPEDRL